MITGAISQSFIVEHLKYFFAAIGKKRKYLFQLLLFYAFTPMNVHYIDYCGLHEWSHIPGYLMDTCLTARTITRRYWIISE